MKIVSIYVSHGSEKFINKFAPRHKGELGDYVYIVNSSSGQYTGLHENFKIIELGKNVGFAAACNIGISHGLRIGATHFILINPDIMLPKSWLMKVKSVINANNSSGAGIFTMPLLEFDFDNDRPTGKVDSFGITHTWYGRWFDISQGESLSRSDLPISPFEIDAACGALMVLTKDVVHELMQKYGYVFDETFFMYKEDIELSLRTRKLGKKVIMIPDAFAYHCRGWSKNRNEMSFKVRLYSAKNELRLNYRYQRFYLIYSLVKYIYVQTIERVFSAKKIYITLS